MNLNERSWLSMKGYAKKSKWVLNVEPLKVFVFDWIVSFGVSTKFGTNLSHFSLTIVNKIKLRHFILKKCLNFSLKRTHQKLLMNFEQECTHILVDLDKIQQRVAVDYNHGQNCTVVNRIPQQWTILNRNFIIQMTSNFGFISVT